jgi:glucose/mannose-6-phosphate isomerase
MNSEELQRIDSEKMYQVYDKWPEIAKASFEVDLEKIHVKDIDHIVFAGMGGSGTIGEVMSSLLSKDDIHVSVVKGYLLPKTVDSNTLVVLTSISGNTDETLTILSNNLKSNAKFIAFSSGGKLQELSQKNNISHYTVPEYHSPRASFPAYLYSIINVLLDILPIKRTDVTESFLKLDEVKNEINSYNLNDKNNALKLAKWISGIPLMYYPLGLQAAAIRYKNSMQENAKTHTIIENVVEASHNGIVAWEKPTEVQPILLQGVDDYIKTKERWKILKEFFNEKEIKFQEVFSKEGSILSKLICLIYQLDFTSIYNAILSGFDPSPVDSINFIKNKLL